MNAATEALLADARHNPGRILLSGLAVLVAIVFAAGTLLLGGTLRAALVAGAVTTPAAAAAVVTGDVDDARASALAATPGATAVAEYRVGYVALRGGTWRVESDPMTGPLTRLPALTAGALPAPGSTGQAVIGTATAERTGLAVGDEIAPGLVVSGIARLAAEGTNALVTTAPAAAALGASVQQVDLAGAPVLPPGPDVRTGEEQRASELAAASSSVTAVIAAVGVFVAVALVAAVIVVASTFRIVLTRQRRRLALLRCVGATRRQVTRAVLAEAAVTGTVAGVVGTGIAVGLGYAVVAGLRAFGVDSPALVVSPVGLVGTVVLGIVATLAAGAGPALAAGRVPPVAALGAAAATEVGMPRRAVRLALALLAALVAAGAIALGLASEDETIAIGLVAVGGLAVFGALVALGPMIVGLVARTAGGLVAGTGPAGRMAVANARQVPRRTAATITVLALGVGLTSALLVGIAGASASAEDSVTRLFPTEVVVQGDGSDLAAVGSRLAADPELAVTVEPERVLVDPRAGVSADAFRAAVDRGVEAAPVFVQYAGDQRREVESGFAVARAVGFGLVGMTLLVAIVGVGVTLMLSVTERTRETGLLRAVGLTRGGVRGMVAAEAAMGGIAAAVLGVVLGGGIGVLGLTAIGFQATTPPFAQLGALVLAVVLVAVGAAMLPALRAARVPPIAALRTP